KRHRAPVCGAAQQIVEAFGADGAFKLLIRDRDKIFGGIFDRRVDHLGLRQLRIAPRSPWRLDEPVAEDERQANGTPLVTRTARSRSIGRRLEGRPRVGQRSGKRATSLPPMVETTGIPACSKAQDAR